MLQSLLLLTRRHPLFPLLIAATLLVDLRLLSILLGVIGWDDLNWTMIVYSAFAAQAGLMGVWCVAARRGWVVRSAITVSLIGATCAPIARYHDAREGALLFAMYVGAMLMVAAGAMLTRSLYAFARQELSAMRFSLSDIVATTTVVALTAAGIRALDAEIREEAVAPAAAVAGLALTSWGIALRMPPLAAAAVIAALYAFAGGVVVWAADLEIAAAIRLLAPQGLFVSLWLAGAAVQSSPPLRREIRRERRIRDAFPRSGIITLAVPGVVEDAPVTGLDLRV